MRDYIWRYPRGSYIQERWFDLRTPGLESFCHPYYGPQYDVENNCVFGPADECAAFVQSYIDAGAKTVLLAPTWPDVGQTSRIAQEVLPRLK